jgi:hypothetical protein
MITGRKNMPEHLPFIINSQAIRFQCLKVIAASRQYNLMASFSQPCGVVASDATSTDHQNL